MNDMNSPQKKNNFTRSNINDTQMKIFEYIQIFLSENGYSPTVRDICEGTGIRSTSTVHAHLKRLRESGKLNYDAGRRRAISINSDNAPTDYFETGNVINLPLVGTVAAGTPILAHENIETTLPFPAEFIKGMEGVPLRVSYAFGKTWGDLK